MARSERPRIAIIGAGPIGLEAALYARKCELPVTVYEAGQAGQHLWQWGHVRMFSPFSWNSTPLGRATIAREKPTSELPDPTDLLTGHEYLERYLLPLAASQPLTDVVRMNARVLHVGRTGWMKDDPATDPKRGQHPFRLLIAGEKNEVIDEADYILDCSGVYGQPRWLGDGGIPARGERAASAHIAYGLDDVLGDRRKHYAGKSIAVVGAGYSAATSISDLATIAEENQATWIIWLVRGPRSQPLPRVPGDPLKERDRLAVRVNTLATRGEGNVEYHPQCLIDAVECHGADKGFRIEARLGGKTTSWEVERIVANVGFKPDLSISAELHVGESPDGQWRTPEPNYFLLGIKSFGRDPRFLLRAGYEQIREVFAHITGKANLDWYAEKG